MRKCLDCNKELQDVDMICTECGSDNLSEIISERPIKSISKKSIGIIATCAIVIIAIVSAIVFGGFVVLENTLSRPCVDGVLAMHSGYFDDYLKEFPESLQSAVKAVYLVDTTSEDYKEQQIKGLKENFGDDYKIECKAVDVIKANSQTVEVVNSLIDDEDELIEEMNHVTVVTVISGSKGETVTSRTVQSVRIDGKWYLFDVSLLS